MDRTRYSEVRTVNVTRNIRRKEAANGRRISRNKRGSSRVVRATQQRGNIPNGGRDKNNNMRNDRFFGRTDERINELLQALRIETRRGTK